MTFTPSTKQRLFLINLAFAGGAAAKKDLKPDLSKPEWQGLRDATLLEQSRVKQAFHFSLTDAGWQWVDEHLADALPNQRVNAEMFGRVLSVVSEYLRAHDIPLAELFRKSARPAPTVPPKHSVAPIPLERAIQAACIRLGDGQTRRRLRLADVRRELPGVDLGAVDRALLDLSAAGKLVMYRMDDPQEIQPDDRELQLVTPSGELRHLVYWTGPGNEV